MRRPRGPLPEWLRVRITREQQRRDLGHRRGGYCSCPECAAGREGAERLAAKLTEQERRNGPPPF